MEYLVLCNMQKSRHQLRQAQICKEGPDKGRIAFKIWPYHLVEVFEGGPSHGRSSQFCGNRTLSSLEGAPDQEKDIVVTCQKVGRAPPLRRLLVPEPSHKICHRVRSPCKLRWRWEAKPLHLRPADQQHQKAELRETDENVWGGYSLLSIVQLT